MKLIKSSSTRIEKRSFSKKLLKGKLEQKPSELGSQSSLIRLSKRKRQRQRRKRMLV
jgi:hypothetical protein